MSLKDWLNKHECSYAEFGAMIGVHRSTVQKYAIGTRHPSIKVAKKIKSVTSGKVDFLK